MMTFGRKIGLSRKIDWKLNLRYFEIFKTIVVAKNPNYTKFLDPKFLDQFLENIITSSIFIK